jgi:murein DD-endopeptidase MepM/ murein hydrolase activator NlpD
LPLEGMWHDGAGPTLHSHHRWAVPEEFAHDFTRIGAGGLPYSGDGTRFADYYAYGQAVLAAAQGEVVAVLDDESVSRGQRIASVGSSGSSTEPHLHFHVCDAADPLACVGIPAQFADVEIYGALAPRQLQSGDQVRNRK